MKKILLLHPFFVFLVLLPIGYTTPDSTVGAIVNGVGIISYLCWTGAIGYYGQSRMKEDSLDDRNRQFFWLSFWLLPILLVIGTILHKVVFTKWPHLVAAILPLLRLVISVAWIWVAIYLGKMLTKLENKQNVEFVDYVIPVILLLPGVSVIGVWFIQPRLTKVFKKQLS